jgi:hypothetical protein
VEKGLRYRDFCGDNEGVLRQAMHTSLKECTKKDPTQQHSPVWVVESDDAAIVNGHSGFRLPLLAGYLVQLYHDRVMYGRSLAVDVAASCR